MLTFDHTPAGTPPPSAVVMGSDPLAEDPSKNCTVRDWFPPVPPWIQNSNLDGAVIVNGLVRLNTAAVHAEALTANAVAPTLTGFVDAGLLGA